MATTHSVLDDLAADQRDLLLRLSRPVSFPPHTRILAKGHRADRFWVLTSGRADLSLHVPGRHDMVVESVGPGGLLGWSWMFPPFLWTVTADSAGSPVEALEFDAAAVRELCREETALGYAFTLACAAVIGERLRTTRQRMLDQYAPYAYREG